MNALKLRTVNCVNIEVLNELRETWATRADSLEKIDGQEDRAAKAIRLCIGELYRACEAYFDDKA